MSKRRIMFIGIIIIAAIALNFGVMMSTKGNPVVDAKLHVELKADHAGDYQVFYGNLNEWTEEASQIVAYEDQKEIQDLCFDVNTANQWLRLDFDGNTQQVVIDRVYVSFDKHIWDVDLETLTDAALMNDVLRSSYDTEQLKMELQTGDPYVLINMANVVSPEELEQATYEQARRSNIIRCVAIDILAIFLIIFYEKFFIFIRDIYYSREMLWSLAKNDFKAKFAGSYFGVFWALVQPIVTIMLYWFVFQVGFKTPTIDEYPFVLWLTIGMVPWLYFQEAWIGATNCMLEYSYLVKKVVFNIDLLPLVKTVSAVFSNVFFLAFMFVLYLGYGYRPSIYLLQIIYYMICMLALVVALSYCTSAFIVFFKDIGQIINILLQIGLWLTPIMWNYQILKGKLQLLVKLNPLFYIIQGYRDATLTQTWFWNRPGLTIYFWAFVSVLFVIGTTVFRNLKPHFADVL